MKKEHNWFKGIFQKNDTSGTSRGDRCVYLDFAATTPLDDRVQEKMIDAMNIYANPGSLHGAGVHAREIIENYRDKIARIVDTKKEQVIFTRGGTEANIMAIHGVIEYARVHGVKKPHVITSMIEHSAVREYIQKLEHEKKISVTYLSHDTDGYIDVKELRENINDETVLVSVMWVNNEIGVRQNIHEISKTLRWYRKHYRKENDTAISYPLFHIDAVQAACLYEVHIPRLGVNLISLAASKMYGPKSTGILLMKRGVEIVPLYFAQDAHEHGMRPGTEDIIGITGASEAFLIAQDVDSRENFQELVKEMREYFLEKIHTWIASGHIRYYGNKVLDDKKDPSHIIAVGVKGISGERLVIELDAYGVACGSRAACSDNDEGISHVLEGCGYNDQDEWGTLRVSLGRTTSHNDIDACVDGLHAIIEKLDREKEYLLV